MTTPLLWPDEAMVSFAKNLDEISSKEFPGAIVVSATDEYTVNLADESSLIDASRRGDSEAFAILVSRYQRMIHGLTYRMSGSAADAADLAQEAFLQAWRRLDCFRGEARFSSWLYRIAMNLCLNWKAREAREALARTKWSELTVGGGNAESDGKIVFLQEALINLSPKQRAAIVLTVYEGLKHDEAARILGCSETTVSWRVFAAKAKLRRSLEKMKSRERSES
jgi:RNA polymerase sigma-70 factor (ECF subfamily)